MPRKSKLTPEEQAYKRELESLDKLSNRIRSRYSFGDIKTYLDLLREAGHPDEHIFKTYFPSELNRAIAFPDIKEFLSDLRINLTTKEWLRLNPPNTTLTEDEIKCQSPHVNTEVSLELAPLPASSIESGSIGQDYKDYIQSPNTNCFLFWFQKKAVKQLLTKVCDEGKRGLMLIAGTGTGKTFIAGEFFRKLLDTKFHEGKSLTPWPYVYVTKASVVEQTKRVFETFFNIDTQNDVLVINIDQLRSKFGELFVNEKCYIERGEEIYKWEWREHINPVVIWWDECQALKNEGSQQSKIGQSFNDIESPYTYQVFSSATPGTRVSEMKCFTVASRIPYSYGVAKDAPMTNNHWSDFSENIASDWHRTDTKPEEHSPAAMERFMNYMDAYVVRVKGVKSQFHAINKVQMIQFETAEGKKFYDSAWERFLQKKAEAEGDESMSAGQARMNILAALTVFRIAAESNPDRVRLLARQMYKSVQSGSAAVAACNFKTTIMKVVDTLVNDYNVPRDKISLIWGGAPKPNKKQKAKAAIVKNAVVMAALESEGITLEDLDLDEIEAAEEQKLDPKLRLGPQNQKARQQEIDRFQAGKSLYCLYTFRAGGVGLSLHHTDEYTKEKVRKKESGYAFEEDIPNIPTRRRDVFVAPTYSAIELVQGLGRAPRLTSLSDTLQILQFYAGTIEERVAHIVSMKLRCLSKVVRQRESWEDVCVGHYRDEDVERRRITDKPVDEESPSDGFFEEEEEDED